MHAMRPRLCLPWIVRSGRLVQTLKHRSQRLYATDVSAEPEETKKEETEGEIKAAPMPLLDELRARGLYMDCTGYN
jgi:hypothetical protein